MDPFTLALIAAGISVGGKIIEGIGSNNAAKTQAKAAAQATAEAKKSAQNALSFQRPIYEQGMQSLGDLVSGVQGGRYTPHQMRYTSPNAPQFSEYGQFSGSYNAQQAPDQQQLQQWNQSYQTPEFNFQADPGYQFRQQQGMNAIENSAAARGTGLSGATLKALQKYGQNLASDEYNNAYNRYQDTRNFGYNQYRDTRGDYETDRALAYQQGRDTRGDYEADRSFGYNQYRDTRGDYEADRAANQALQQQQYGRYQDIRDFGYGQTMDQYNQDAQRRQNLYNMQAGLGNLGVGAAGNMSNIYTNLGNQVTGNTLAAGNARAAGQVGVSNAVSSGLQTLGQLPFLYNYTNLPSAVPQSTNVLSGVPAPQY